MAHFTMAQDQYDAFHYGAFHYSAGPVWRIPVCRSSGWCGTVTVCRSFAVVSAFCLDNNLYINDLQTEHSDRLPTATVSTFDVPTVGDTLVFGRVTFGPTRNQNNQNNLYSTHVVAVNKILLYSFKYGNSI